MTPEDIRKADHMLVVLSDIEIGTGGHTDDFPQSAALGQLILGYNEPPYADVPLSVVLNGDTLDLLKVPLDGTYHRHVTEAIALKKLQLIQAAHGPFFDALREFLAHSGARRELYFTVGNHDAELVFPQVQRAICERLGCSERVHFPGFSVEIGDVWIEHGSQADPLFAVDPKRVFLSYRGEQLLNLPWGAVGIIDVALPMHSKLYHLDRLQPRERVLTLMPAFKQLLIGSYWRYWTRDYWRTFAGDPMRRASWTMAKEIAYRFASNDPDVRISSHYRKMVETDRKHRVLIVGHEHRAGWWSYGDRKLLRTGAFRNEFMMREQDGEIDQICPVYAEVLLRDGRAFRSGLVEVAPTPPPAGYAPESMYDVLPAIHQFLSEIEDLASVDAERAAQEKRERREKRQAQ